MLLPKERLSTVLLTLLTGSPNRGLAWHEIDRGLGGQLHDTVPIPFEQGSRILVPLEEMRNHLTDDIVVVKMSIVLVSSEDSTQAIRSIIRINRNLDCRPN